jgi:hypothetical protein
MASELTVQTIKGPTSGANANTVIVPAGQTLTAPGHVIQVVTVTITNSTAVSTGSFADLTGASASITPSSTSSTILLMGNLNNIRNNGALFTALNLQRQIASGGYSSLKSWDEVLGYVDNNTASVTPWYSDSPNTTSQVDYKFQARRLSGSGSSTFQARIGDGGSGQSTITLMEIAG